jgi:hypothetical protein
MTSKISKKTNSVSDQTEVGEVDFEEQFNVDETIKAFFKEHPSLHFRTMTHIFIDILKKLSTNLTETITSSTNQKILSLVSDIKRDISGFKYEVTAKLHDIKKEYIEDVKMIISNGHLTMTEKIQSIMDKNNEIILTKTNGIVNEVVPKTQEKYYSQLDATIKQMHQSINQETSKLANCLDKEDKDKEQEFVNLVDSQFNKMIVNLQQPIFSFIQSSEERTTGHVQQMREKMVLQQSAQELMNQELHQFLNKYQNNSSSKGNFSETEVQSLLEHIFPTDEIVRTTGETASGDFIVYRTDKKKPSILFENKNYDRKVSSEEVEKFKRDVQNKKIHGIFLSQNTNITYKSDYKIDIINGLIHIYLPNLNYNREKLQVAVDIVDNLSSAFELLQSHDMDVVHCTKEDIDDLLEMYNTFAKQKIMMMDNIKNFVKQISENIEEINMSIVRKILNKNGRCVEEDFKCKFCNFVGKNKGSVSAHMRTCKSNPDSAK